MKKTNLVLGILLIMLLAVSGNSFAQNNCLDFDGTDDYVAVTNNASLQPTSAFTLEAWVNVDVTVNYSSIIDNGFATGSGINRCGGYVLGLNTSTTKRFRFWACNGMNYPANRTVITSDLLYNEDTWYHVAAVYTGSNLILYVNGIQEGIASFSGSINYTQVNLDPSYGMNIGRFHDDNETYEFNGMIDEIRIWNTARTAVQIRKNMCKTLIGDESGLAAYYNFDNTSSATLQDFSGNTNDETITINPSLIPGKTETRKMIKVK